MSQMWNGWVVLTALTVTAIGAFLWKRKRYTYQKVGRISKLYIYPIKSLRGIPVNEGKCTPLGFEVNGLLDRSFMLMSDDHLLLSQRQAPTLALLQVRIVDKQLIVTGPNVDLLTIDIKPSPCPSDKIVECRIHTDLVNVVDCGDEPSEWFQNYLKLPNVRLVRFFEDIAKRKYTQKNPFFAKLRKNNPISFQDLAAFHVCSQPSIDDVNSKIGENKVSVFNFRPNVLVEGCEPFAEDSWRYMKFNSGAEIVNDTLVTRCIFTTVEPDTGILTQKEPLITLRKYRIPKDPDMLKKTGPLPCLGTACNLVKSGEIKLNDDILAVVTKQPEMALKLQS